MKRTVIAAAGFAFATACGLANAASWSVFVEPGVYGRVAIGGYAEAPMVYEPQPVIVVDDGYGQLVEETVDTAYATDQPPVYLWVPEYQRLHWARYCREYGAYGVPVYFVDDGWYRANVMRRNWSPEQRSWSQQQWLEQDRLARDRFERQRFEQQRYEQQQRWNQQREWRDPRGGRSEPGRDDGRGGAPAQWGRGQADGGGQDRLRWGSARGGAPQQGQPMQQPQSVQPSQNNGVPRPQAGGQWQQQGGQWQQQPGAQWQQRGGQGQGPQGGNAGAPQGNGGALQANGGAPQGNGGTPPANGGRGAWPQNGGAQSLQSPPASQARGGQGRTSGDRRGDDRTDGSDRRSPAEARGGYERGHEGRRDR